LHDPPRQRLAEPVPDDATVMAQFFQLDALAERAPGCSISTLRNTSDTLAEGLQNGTIDLAVGLLPHLQAGFFQQRLFHHRYATLNNPSVV